MRKLITAAEAADKIRDGDTVCWTSVGLVGFCEEIAIAVENKFKETGHPRNLTLVHDSGCGDGRTHRGMQHLAYEGLVSRLVSGHTGHAKNMGKLIQEDKIEAHLLPQGVMVTLWRQIAGKKPGVITKVGMGTYVDPRLEGGKASPSTKRDLVKLIDIEGEQWLLYKSFPVNVAVIRATTADENGNLTMDREALLLEALPMAQAAKNCGGIVIAQVQYLAKAGTLHPKQVKIPGVCVDYVVVARPENHMQTGTTAFSPSLAGDIRVPASRLDPMPLDERKLVARRAALELIPGKLVNLGIGMPDGVARVAAEEGVIDLINVTTEIGTYGGVPIGGADFGCTNNADAMIEHDAQFDYYDGGGLDMTFLGMGQVDQVGNVNVSRFGTRFVGPGGFINISQSAKMAVFCGSFNAGAELAIRDGKLVIEKEGKIPKFLQQVDQITFSGKYAASIGQRVMYVTERAVFVLEADGLVLTEIAPGIDLERDVLAHMGFRPRIATPLKTMDAGLFQPTWGGLAAVLDARVKASGG